MPQWDASLRFDQRAALPGVTALVHVIAFAEDVEAPPEDGEELARLIPGAKFHLLEGLGHGSWYGLAHEEINKVWRGLYRRIDNRACALR